MDARSIGKRYPVISHGEVRGDHLLHDVGQRGDDLIKHV
jgi:hypothetical protein